MYGVTMFTSLRGNQGPNPGLAMKFNITLIITPKCPLVQSKG